MATARQIVALLNSHVQGDEEQFLSIALQVAAAEARRGRIEISDELKKLVDKVRSQRLSEHTQGSATRGVPIPINRPRGDLQTLLGTTYPRTTLEEVALRPELRKRLERIVHQQQSRAKLRDFAQIPTTRLLLVGPPGCGKTLTASALAGELRLPLFTVRLESVITRFMGETAAKLRLIFDQISIIRGVYLFDEFDAIGGRRNADNDVGEMRRVLNSFLQFLEESNSTDSLVVSATNHPELLDRALFRRFDDVLEYSLPDADAIASVIKANLSAFHSDGLVWPTVVDAALGLSQAEIVRACREVIKNAVLGSYDAIDTIEVVAAFRERHAVREAVLGIVDG